MTCLASEATPSKRAFTAWGRPRLRGRAEQSDIRSSPHPADSAGATLIARERRYRCRYSRMGVVG
jgi:hypothetical protein